MLDSDIDKEYIQLQARGVSIGNITRCELFGKLLEDKLYAHHAIQDSITVNELEIRSNIEQQISAFLEQKGGSMTDLLEFYNKDSEQSLREEMFEINKNAINSLVFIIVILKINNCFILLYTLCADIVTFLIYI